MNLDSVSENKLKIDIELTKLKPKLDELQKLLSEANDTISNLKTESNFAKEKALEMEHNIRFKEKTIENSKSDLEERKKEIDNLTEIAKLNQKETKELIDKIKSLEIKLSAIKSTPKVLERIKETMAHKGFITDREIEKIFKEFN